MGRYLPSSTHEPALLPVRFHAMLIFGLPTIVPISALDISSASQSWGKPAVNTTVDGKPITIGGKVFETGFGTHAISEFIIDIKRQALSFEATVGVDDEVGKHGSVRFQVWGDNRKLWESNVIRGG